ncbi:MAG: hypothetical protein II769_04675 [Oscillospiraceae bacterium]|jgi:hypothetical protein|nr:hypothetical protein [Oscillospiraceae bacterium]
MAALIVVIVVFSLLGVFSRRFLAAHRNAGVGFNRVLVFLGSLLWAAMLVCAVISLIMIFVEPGAKWIAITAVCVALPVLALLLLCKKPAEQA